MCTQLLEKVVLEGTMLKLKLQYFGHLMQRADSLEKTLMLGIFEGRRRKGKPRMRWLDGITDLMDMSLGKLQKLMKAGRPGVLQSMGSQRVGHDWATERKWIWMIRQTTFPDSEFPHEIQPPIRFQQRRKFSYKNNLLVEEPLRQMLYMHFLWPRSSTPRKISHRFIKGHE